MTVLDIHADIIDEMGRLADEEERAFAEPTEAREGIARQMQAAGVTPHVSTGIHGRLTYGYGMLDQFGFWQYPLPDGEDVK